MHDSLKNYSQDSVEAAEEILLSMGIKKNPTNTGELAAIIDTHFKSLSQRAEQAKARVQELETEDDNALEAYKLLQADTAALRAALARVTAERDANKNSVEAYLSERVCCSGEICGCGGITRLQQLVHEEAGTTIDRLSSEHAALRAANAELAGALQAVLANRHQLEGEAMFLVLPECEEHARALLTRQQTK